MKTSTKIAVAFATLAGLGGAALTAQADSRWHDRGTSQTHMQQQAYGGMHRDGMRRDGRHHGGRHHGGHGSRGGYRMFAMMESFDLDSDGRLSQEEIDRSRGERFSSFDADADQALTLAEYERLWLDAMREVMVDRFQDLDADGDARVTAEEFKRPFAKMVRRMDRNEDGVLDDNDRHRRHHGPQGGPQGAPMKDDNG